MSYREITQNNEKFYQVHLGHCVVTIPKQYDFGSSVVVRDIVQNRILYPGSTLHHFVVHYDGSETVKIRVPRKGLLRILGYRVVWL